MVDTNYRYEEYNRTSHGTPYIRMVPTILSMSPLYNDNVSCDLDDDRNASWHHNAHDAFSSQCDGHEYGWSHIAPPVQNPPIVMPTMLFNFLPFCLS